MLLLIRGHIRDGFDTPHLYIFAKMMRERYAVDIYIQTWCHVSNKLSWRPIQENKTAVTEDTIRTYFKDVPIKCILILDDTTIRHHGSTEGTVVKSMIPKIGWKNMWFGKATLAKHVSSQNDPATLVINTRFDLFSCERNSQTIAPLAKFIEQNKTHDGDTIVFSTPYNTAGVDNIYMGTAAANERLSSHFNENLDIICARPEYSHIENPEKMVFLENHHRRI
jgi:hypothetical protein